MSKPEDTLHDHTRGGEDNMTTSRASMPYWVCAASGSDRSKFGPAARVPLAIGEKGAGSPRIEVLLSMVVLHEASTDALSPAFLRELRAMLDVAYDGDFSDQDWHHAVGGKHVWVTGQHGLVAHASLVARTLVCSGKTLHVGFVEAVATAASHRRRGHGARVMRRIGELIREGYPLGVLSTGTHAFYETLGWERWRGPTFVDGPNGRERTPADDGDVMILRTSRSPHLDFNGDIVCDWRLGDVW